MYGAAGRVPGLRRTDGSFVDGASSIELLRALDEIYPETPLWPPANTSAHAVGAMVDALAILQAATVLFMNEPSVVDVHVPENGRCIVVGDLHGQLVRERDDDAPTPRVVVVTRRGSPRDPSE